MITLTNQSGQPIQLAQELGRGGEGAVFALAGRKDAVAKLYHPDQRTALREAKLSVMVANPPRDAVTFATVDPSKSVLPALAWPHELIYERGKFAGFVMPRIDHCPNIFEIYNPKLRLMRYPKVDRRFLHHAARNLAIVLAGLHAGGYVMGDVNQKNILVNPQALVTLVDADSFQVADGNGAVYRCAVGVPEYTPPELQGKVLAQLDRRPQHDCFGLSVLLFQLLMEGYHPFTGRPISSSVKEVSQLSIHCIQYGIFPYQNNQDVQPPPGAPNFCWLHPELQQLFVATFLVAHRSPEVRPNAMTWARALGNAEANLGRCDRNPSHWYSRHLEGCPYCPKTKTVSIPAKPIYSAAWQPRNQQNQQNQRMPIGCWANAINALLLPIVLMIGIPFLMWLIRSELYVLIFVILGGLAKAGLLKQVIPWLVRMAQHSARGAQQMWQWITKNMAYDTLVATGFALVVVTSVAIVLLSAKPVPRKPAPTYLATRVPATQVVSPISPLLNVSPLATPSKTVNQ